jgi:hypothetical protein
VTPAEFFELPQGTPSINTIAATLVGYCTASDVASLVKSRVIGAGNNPTITDVNGYIQMISGQMDAVMLTKGYQVPVNVASYPEVTGFLSWVNAQGAAWMMEVSSPTSVEVDRLEKAFDNAMAMLTDGKFSMDVPVQQQRAEVRAPFVTYHPTGRYYDPTFSSGDGDGISRGDAYGSRRDPFFVRNVRF